MMGRVDLLDEPTGPAEEAQQQADRVGRRFLGYLEMLQPDGIEDGPESESEFEIEIDDDQRDEVEAVR